MSPDLAISAIAARQYGVFTHSQATRAGFSRSSVQHRIAAGIWVVLHRGVYAMASTSPSWHRDAFAAVAAYGPKAVAASTTAAALLAIAHETSPLHVALPSGCRREPRGSVVPHQMTLKRADVRVVQAIPATAPNRTLVDCAAVFEHDQLEDVLDKALFRGLTSVLALGRYIRDRRLTHRPGVGNLTTMLAERVDGTSQSKLERIFFRKLKQSRLPLPKRQLAVGRRLIDIAYPDKHLIIELDGRETRYSRTAFQADRRRQNEVLLALPGWTLLRFTWDDVVNHWPDVEAILRGVLRD